MSSPPLVVALAELTQMLGVTKNRAMQVSKKSDFPAPVAEYVRSSSGRNPPPPGVTATGGIIGSSWGPADAGDHAAIIKMTSAAMSSAARRPFSTAHL